MPDDRINFFLFSFCKVASIAGEGKVPCSEEGSIRVATRSEPNSTVNLFFSLNQQNVNKEYLKLVRSHFSLYVFSFGVLGNSSREYDSSKRTFVTGLAGRKAQLLEWWCPSLLL